MKKISELTGKYMALIVLAIAALALFLPGTCLWIQTKWINYLLMVVMFGMGLTMKLSDFTVVFRQPRDVITGCAAQFLIMPLLAFSLGKIFGLSDELLVDGMQRRHRKKSIRRKLLFLGAERQSKENAQCRMQNAEFEMSKSHNGHIFLRTGALEMRE